MARNMQKSGAGMWPFLAAMAAGAALMYFFDPARGTRRRHITSAEMRSDVDESSENMSKWMHFFGGHVYGVIQSILRLNPPDNPSPDDLTLKDRVMSEVFRDPQFADAPINVNVVNGIVVLRGELPHPETINKLIARVQDVPDVRGVESYLHLPGTLPPNKREVITARIS